MKWSMQQLHRYNNEPLEFEDTLDLSCYSCNVSDIIKMDLVSVKGNVLSLSYERFKFVMNIKTNLYLYESRTLDEIIFPIDLNVNVVYSANPTDEEELIEQNTVDPTPFIWESILLEIPIRIVSD